MNLYRRPNSPYWYADLRSYGYGQRSTKLTDRDQAEAAIFTFLASKGRAPKASSRKLSDLIAAYEIHARANKTPNVVKHDLRFIRDFLGFSGDQPLSALEPLVFEQYKVYRLSYRRKGMGPHKDPVTVKEPIKPATLKRQINPLRHMFNVAVEWGWMDRSPMDRVKNPKVPKTKYRKSYDLSEVGLILSNSSHRQRKWWILYLSTGIRLEEGFGIKKEHIRDGLIEIRGKDDKGNKEGARKTVIATDEFIQELSDWPDEEGGYLLPRINKRSLSRIFSKVLTKTGLPGSFKWLRDTYGNHALDSGVRLDYVRENYNHASLETTQIYMNSVLKRRLEVMRKIKFCDTRYTFKQVES